MGANFANLLHSQEYFLSFFLPLLRPLQVISYKGGECRRPGHAVYFTMFFSVRDRLYPENLPAIWLVAATAYLLTTVTVIRNDNKSAKD